MKDRMKQYVIEQGLINQGDRILAAVSGGADSVCLLYLLNELRDELGFELSVVHINHGLRGEEADEDEAYVKDVCGRLGLHFHAYHMDVHELARRTGMSLEEAGRKARYDAFLEEGESTNCNKVALAHHMNDTVETMLFHMIRGSGLRGLTGIPAKRSLGSMEVIRPLLCVRRDEIENYLQQKEIPYCVDSTNLENTYSRNKLRNQVIPFLKEEMNERVVEHIAQTARLLNEVNEYMNHNVERAYETYVHKEEVEGLEAIYYLDISVEAEHPMIQKEVIRKIIEQMMPMGLKNIETIHIEQVKKLVLANVGKQLHLPHGLLVRKKYQEVVFSFFEESSNRMKQLPTMIEINIHEYGEYELPQIGKTLLVDVKKNKKNSQIPKNGYTKWFDYDKIKNTVFIRTKRPGDYLQVGENGGRKKLKDYFIDRKIPKEERDERLLLADGSHILWVLEDRTSEAYRVDAKTENILVISLIGGNDHGYQR